MIMERDRLSPSRYSYLNQRDSDLYDRFVNVDSFEARIIITLIEEKQKSCMESQRSSKY
jgi:hypothetical protein